MPFKKLTHNLVIICAGLLAALSLSGEGVSASPDGAVPSRRVNATYWSSDDTASAPAIFWFGEIDLTGNYIDGRIGYAEDSLWLAFHITDRLLRYDETATPADIKKWDAVSVYLDLSGNTGSTVGPDSYQFILQLNGLNAAFKGSGSSWAAGDVPFSVISGWRGDGGMNDDYWDKGWVAQFKIPFSSLGLSGPPAAGTLWGLAVAVHDRDETGLSIPDRVWPGSFGATAPETWGQLHFGLPAVQPVFTAAAELLQVRQGLQGAQVEDAHVGGHVNCGGAYGPSYWEGWGSANYAGYDQVNVQSQWDIADWPCFSKYFVTFPLNSIPAGKNIISARLQMHVFGNAGGGQWGEAPDSYIQVLTVSEDWDESTITWNSAPLAEENIGGRWVRPRDANPNPFWPGDAYSWDVTYALLDSVKDNQPLRLALYSADGDYHTGKYFSSSDTEAWNAAARPTLIITFGTPCTPETCAFMFLPLLIK